MTTAPNDIGRIDDLELILRAQLETHRQLLQAIDCKGDALRTADIDRVTAQCRTEQELVERLSELEQRRVHLVSSMSGADGPRTMSQLAAAVEEPRRSHLLSLTEELRAVVAETRRRSSVVRDAAETLNRHLVGIMQLANAALSRARIYGSRGRIDVGAQRPACVDLRS